MEKPIEGGLTLTLLYILRMSLNNVFYFAAVTLTVVLLVCHCFSRLKLGAFLKVYIFIAVDEVICCEMSSK